jgi:hypothetical protein
MAMQQQIPFGDDRKKSKSKDKSRSFDSLRSLRMTSYEEFEKNDKL